MANHLSPWRQRLEEPSRQIVGRINKDLPIILNSAYSTYKSDFQSWLADAYVVKSSNLEELKRKVKELVSL